MVSIPYLPRKSFRTELIEATSSTSNLSMHILRYAESEPQFWYFAGTLYKQQERSIDINLL